MLFYNLFLVISLVLLSPFWLVKIIFSPKWRAGFSQRLGFHLPVSSRPVIWLHAASVGEAKLAAGLIKALKQKKPA